MLWTHSHLVLHQAGWPILHHGSGVGTGLSQHADMVMVCDATSETDTRLARILWHDPAMGVMWRADAGYTTVLPRAEQHQLMLPMIKQSGKRALFYSNTLYPIAKLFLLTIDALVTYHYSGDSTIRAE